MISLRLPRLLQSLALVALIPVAAFAQKNASGSGSTSGATVIPGGSYASAYIIVKPGSYVLGGDRLVTTAASHNIEIQAPDVTLDLGGFVLSHPAGSTGAGSGVHMEAAENVEVRNGSIVNSAFAAVRAKSGKGLRIVGLRISGSVFAGVYSLAEDTHVESTHIADSGNIGLVAQGLASVVQDCIITNSAGTGVATGSNARVLRTTVRSAKIGLYVGAYGYVSGSHVSQATTAGLWVTGSYGMIRDNLVANNTSYGVYLAPGVVAVDITGNTIAQTKAAGATQVGIASSALSNVVAENRLTQNGTNIQGSYTNGGGNVLQ